MKPVDEELELARLLASEASPLGSSLSVLRERGPDASELGVLASRLSLGGVDVNAPTKAPAAAARAPWKPWAITGGGVALGLLWLGLRGTAPTQVESRDANARIASLEAQRSQAAPSLPGEARGTTAAKPTPSGVATEPSLVDASRPAQAAQAAEASPNPAQLPASETLRPRADAADGTSATSGGAARTSSQPVSGATPAPAPAPSSVAGAPTEIELLRDARLALRQSPAAALGLAEQHARLYPNGKLTQERELLAITALVATGRRTAALSRGARFEQTFPTSPYRKQLGELLK